LRARNNGCWTAQLIDAFKGLRSGEAYEHVVLEGRPIPMNNLVADLHFRFQEVSRAIEGDDAREQQCNLLHIKLSLLLLLLTSSGLLLECLDTSVLISLSMLRVL
jgi:hypothetical protein